MKKTKKRKAHLAISPFLFFLSTLSLSLSLSLSLNFIASTLSFFSLIPGSIEERGMKVDILLRIFLL